MARRRSIILRPSFTITRNHRRTVTPTIDASVPPPKPPCSTVWLFATTGPKGSLPRPMGAERTPKAANTMVSPRDRKDNPYFSGVLLQVGHPSRSSTHVSGAGRDPPLYFDILLLQLEHGSWSFQSYIASRHWPTAETSVDRPHPVIWSAPLHSCAMAVEARLLQRALQVHGRSPAGNGDGAIESNFLHGADLPPMSCQTSAITLAQTADPVLSLI